MITEKEFLSEIAEIILAVFENPEMGLTKEAVCEDGHFSPKMLTANKLLRMRGETLMRLLLYLATTMSERELYKIFIRLFQHINFVASHDGVSAYNIIDNHAGFPLMRNFKNGYER